MASSPFSRLRRPLSFRWGALLLALSACESETPPSPNANLTKDAKDASPTQPGGDDAGGYAPRDSAGPPSGRDAGATNGDPVADAGRSPPSSTWPQAFNTGYPHGLPGDTRPPVSLTLHAGNQTITEDGAVIDGWYVTGILYVRAHNVTIRNSHVVGCASGGAIDNGYGPNGPTLISDTEIEAPSTCGAYASLGNVNFTCIRCDVHGGGSGIRMDGNVTVEDSYVHDLHYKDPAHETAIGSNGGAHFKVLHNNLECNSDLCSAALSFYGDFGPIDDALVQNNLLNTSGSFCTYAGSLPRKPYPHATNVRYIDNHFGRLFKPKCGIYGPVTSWEANAGNVWQGNVWEDTGATVDPAPGP